MEATDERPKSGGKVRFMSRLKTSRNGNKRSSRSSKHGPSTPPPKEQPDTPPLTPVETDDEDASSSSSPVAERRQDVSRNKADAFKSFSREGVQVITSRDADQFKPSDVREPEAIVREEGEDADEVDDKDDAPSKTDPAVRFAETKGREKSPARTRSKGGATLRGQRQTVVLKRAPSAAASAYAGPPRYDWIDIETAAAVKVQSAYRRNKVMWDLEKQGLSTAAMRNRMRERKTRQRLMVSEDVPDLLKFCGISLLFGDATAEDREAKEAYKKQKFEEKRRKQQEAEEKKRKYRWRKKADVNLDEAVEVVEDVTVSEKASF